MYYKYIDIFVPYYAVHMMMMMMILLKILLKQTCFSKKIHADTLPLSQCKQKSLLSIQLLNLDFFSILTRSKFFQFFFSLHQILYFNFLFFRIFLWSGSAFDWILFCIFRVAEGASQANCPGSVCRPSLFPALRASPTPILDPSLALRTIFRG